MNLRSNKRMLYAAGIGLLVLAVELAGLGISTFRFSAINRTYAQEERRLLRLRQREPFPSAANKAALEKQVDELTYRVGELYGVLSRDPVPFIHAEPAELSAHIQAKVERFSRNAVRAGVQLPETLEGGFSKYASGGAVAAPEDVPRLMRQLHSVSVLADVLVDAGVKSIDRMDRELFEEEDAPAAARRRRPTAAARAEDRGGKNSAASEAGPGVLYLTERIDVAFSADEAGVWRVLTALAESPRFMGVVSFSHRTESKIMDYSPRAVKRGSDADDETSIFLREGILRGEKALSRPERIIAGNEFVQVEMTVDVYNFNPEVLYGRSRK